MSEIVITGSTGVIGRRAVGELVAAGHRVTGVTRSAGGRARLESLGARAVEADAFDAASLRRAFDARCRSSSATVASRASTRSATRRSCGGSEPRHRVSTVRYVALLRGINVGGRTLVRMADLKTCFESLGFGGVSTYIASGNVLFESDEDDGVELAGTIESAIEQRFELPVKVAVFDRDAYSRIVQAIPKPWIGDAALRANVAFLRSGTDARQVVRELEPDPAIEHVKAVDGAILWATRRDALNRSVMRKLIGGAAYKELTVRNLNTTLKLNELLGG